MNEKALYISKLEFSVIAAISGLSQFYCFDLGTDENVGQEELIQAVYQIIKNGWGRLDEQGLQLYGEMKQYIDGIARAKWVIEIRDDSGKQSLCYLSTQIILLTMDANHMLRIVKLVYGELLSWLEDNMLIPGKICWDSEKEALEEISVQEKDMMEQGKILLLPRRAECIVRDKNGGNIIGQYILAQGLLNLWFIYMDSRNKVNWFAPDTTEQRWKMQREWEEMGR